MAKQQTQLRVIERKNGTAKRGTRVDFLALEAFRRDLYFRCGERGALVAFRAGRTIRRNWSKANARICVTFGAGKKALDSFIRVTVNGKKAYEGTV